jgi:hypothetical protein
MRTITFFAALLFLAQNAWGQTTRPEAAPSPEWERQVSSLAAALVSHDGQAVQALLSPDCHIARFNTAPDADDSQFLDAVSAESVIADHAYVFPPSVVVADIARDVNASTIIPEFTKHTLNLNDKSGRSIALEWMTQAIGASDGDLVGIIVTWDSRQETDDQHRLNFVLLKGASDGNGFKFTRIVYGDPLQ